MSDNIRIRIAESQSDLRKALDIRFRVFVDEQNVPKDLEQDGLDRECLHFLAFADNVPVGTGRLREIDAGTVKIERMAVLQNYRNMGIGRQLLDRMLQHIRSAGYENIVLHAQAPAAEFYQRAGFQPQGDTFYEADIPHLRMVMQVEE
ncbi:MAG: GNAT family N-acetyltransferase [Candidatus Marinimicrobia bacterium]|nr:GNAT family N-acetyltransferase [Candidatus Neomarinimicrobiota bacterium]